MIFKRKYKVWELILIVIGIGIVITSILFGGWNTIFLTVTGIVAVLVFVIHESKWDAFFSIFQREIRLTTNKRKEIEWKEK